MWAKGVWNRKDIGYSMKIIISQVEKDSIADELGLSEGDEIISINSTKPRDIIDYSFCIRDENILLHIKHKDGEEELFEIEKDYEDDLGISFESAVFDRVKPCANKCIFCFVDQQPKGLRESLYVKDDDWRLSYLQGTYITLTNMSEKDWQRLEAFHPSPLFVSIHTTNPSLRAKMTNNPKAANILADLDRLKKNDIKIHAQIVLCPSYNDGDELLRTLEDLKKYKKIIQSIAIVPVGISRYRKEKLKPVDSEIAKFVIEAVDKFNQDVKKNLLMASDEFFLLAGQEIPPKKYYGKFSQIEDGVGAVRLLIDDFEKCTKKFKKKLKNPTKLTLFTGLSAAKIFDTLKEKISVENLDFEVIGVKNKFFGDMINVSGLVVGEDIKNLLESGDYQNVIIPSIMLREGTDEFLDGIKISDFKKKFPKINFFVINNCYKFQEILTIINSF